jgi:hypothetical protein
MRDRVRTALAAWAMGGAVASAGAFAPQAAAAKAPAAQAQAAAPAPSDDAAAQPQADTAAQFAQWVAASGDNRRRPFAVVDKLGAELFVFDTRGRLKGKAPVLLGIAPGDESAPGVGDYSKLGGIPADQRTTPAGSFFAFYGPDHHGRSVLWIDWRTGLALHRVEGRPEDRRLQRLKSATPEDNRITYGCVNVAAAFYDRVLRPTFKGKHGGVVYILPDTKPLKAVFPTYRPSESTEQAAAATAVVAGASAEGAARHGG